MLAISSSNCETRTSLYPASRNFCARVRICASGAHSALARSLVSAFLSSRRGGGGALDSTKNGDDDDGGRDDGSADAVPPKPYHGAGGIDGGGGSGAAYIMRRCIASRHSRSNRTCACHCCILCMRSIAMLALDDGPARRCSGGAAAPIPQLRAETS